jgi:hypothetical protein
MIEQPSPPVEEIASPPRRRVASLIKSPRKTPARVPTGRRPGRPRKQPIVTEESESLNSGSEVDIEEVSEHENESVNLPKNVKQNGVHSDHESNTEEESLVTSNNTVIHSHSTPLKKALMAAASAISGQFSSFTRSLKLTSASNNAIKEVASNTSTPSKYESVNSSRSGSPSPSGVKTERGAHFLSKKSYLEVFDDEDEPVETLKQHSNGGGSLVYEMSNISLLQIENKNVSINESRQVINSLVDNLEKMFSMAKDENKNKMELIQV